jgi:hypothetical protein
MAIEMRTSVPGMTAEQAAPAIAVLRDKIPTYPGFIAHASGMTAGGLRVTELWESREAHERWVREVIAPLLEHVGVQEAPAIEYLEVADVITP